MSLEHVVTAVLTSSVGESCERCYMRWKYGFSLSTGGAKQCIVAAELMCDAMPIESMYLY